MNGCVKSFEGYLVMVPQLAIGVTDYPIGNGVNNRLYSHLAISPLPSIKEDDMPDQERGTLSLDRSMAISSLLPCFRELAWLG